MQSIEIGKNIRQKQGYFAFVPNPFPPKGLVFDRKILKKENEATRLLGKLDGITKLLPDASFFLLMYLRKDAASSSQIEGTMATMIDAIEAEMKVNPEIPQDVDDILHYIATLKYGMKRVTGDNFPITLRFIKELHSRLMSGARATHSSDPGEFRHTQNWVGGTKPENARFVPPPVSEMKTALEDLEKFIHADDYLLPVIKASLLHAQFETIHPFLDGNGRTGRMLITFYLWQEKILENPVLFLSSYFKKHQKLYYQKLFGYHNGQFEDWIEFFLDGVIEIANEAIEIVEKITKLRERDTLKIQNLSKRSSESACLILPRLFAQPIVDVATIQKWTDFSRPGAQRLIDRFIKIGILAPREKGKKYGQTYIYRKYVDIFSNNN